MAAFAWAPSEAADNRSTVDHSASDEMIVFCDEGDGKNIEYHNSLVSRASSIDQQEHEYHNSGSPERSAGTERSPERSRNMRYVAIKLRSLCNRATIGHANFSRAFCNFNFESS